MALSKELSLLVSEIIDELRLRNQTISTAESLTAGELSNALTSIAGASDVFVGGITAYQSSIKVSHLKVDPKLIAQFSVVSEEVALAMAQGVRASFGSTWAISTTGVAGPAPSGGHEAGKAWIAIDGPRSATLELFLPGERELVRNAVTGSAIAAFARILNSR